MADDVHIKEYFDVIDHASVYESCHAVLLEYGDQYGANIRAELYPMAHSAWP